MASYLECKSYVKILNTMQGLISTKCYEDSAKILALVEASFTLIPEKIYNLRLGSVYLNVLSFEAAEENYQRGWGCVGSLIDRIREDAAPFSLETAFLLDLASYFIAIFADPEEGCIDTYLDFRGMQSMVEKKQWPAGYAFFAYEPLSVQGFVQLYNLTLFMPDLYGMSQAFTSLGPSWTAYLISSLPEHIVQSLLLPQGASLSKEDRGLLLSALDAMVAKHLPKIYDLVISLLPFSFTDASLHAALAALYKEGLSNGCQGVAEPFVLDFLHSLEGKEIQRLAELFACKQKEELPFLANALCKDPIKAIDVLASSKVLKLQASKVRRVAKKMLPSLPKISLPHTFTVHSAAKVSLEIPTEPCKEMSLTLPTGEKLTLSQFSEHPVFYPLLKKEQIFLRLKALSQESMFGKNFTTFLETLTKERWFIEISHSPIDAAHMATLAFFSSAISLEEFFIIHRACEAIIDDSVDVSFAVLTAENAPAFFKRAHYPPYFYHQKVLAEGAFFSWLDIMGKKSIIERTAVLYSIKQLGRTNIEWFIAVRGGYKEGMLKVDNSSEGIFFTLLPPCINISLYNLFVEKPSQRPFSLEGYHLGFSEDKSLFFRGKRPVSIASPYYSMEGLKDLTIHGFEQPSAKALGLDFHDTAYHLPIEMNLSIKQLQFFSFMAKALHSMEDRLFTLCEDPIRRSRYQKVFECLVDVITDREVFVAGPHNGHLLDKRVDFSFCSARIIKHPLYLHALNMLPAYDRLEVFIGPLPAVEEIDESSLAIDIEELYSEGEYCKLVIRASGS